MSRKSYVAWADTTDPNDFTAGDKAVGAGYAPGLELPVPSRAQSVALDLIVTNPAGATELYILMESSRDKNRWAVFTAYDVMTLVGSEAQASARNLAIKVTPLFADLAQHMRFNVKESDFIRFSLRGDVAGAICRATVTFHEEDT